MENLKYCSFCGGKIKDQIYFPWQGNFYCPGCHNFRILEFNNKKEYDEIMNFLNSSQQIKVKDKLQ